MNLVDTHQGNLSAVEKYFIGITAMGYSEKDRREIAKITNESTAATNKLLAALNSGAFLAFLIYWSDANTFLNSPDFPKFSPLHSFALGLTAILLNAACSYFGGVFAVYYYDLHIKYGKYIFWVATFSSILSGLCFLYGVWIIAIII